MSQLSQEIQSVINRLERDADRAESFGDTLMATALRARRAGAIMVQEAVSKWADSDDRRLACIVKSLGRKLDEGEDGQSWTLSIPVKDCVDVKGTVYSADSSMTMGWNYFEKKSK